MAINDKTDKVVFFGVTVIIQDSYVELGGAPEDK